MKMRIQFYGGIHYSTWWSICSYGQNFLYIRPFQKVDRLTPGLHVYLKKSNLSISIWVLYFTQRPFSLWCSEATWCSVWTLKKSFLKPWFRDSSEHIFYKQYNRMKTKKIKEKLCNKYLNANLSQLEKLSKYTCRTFVQTAQLTWNGLLFWDVRRNKAESYENKWLGSLVSVWADANEIDRHTSSHASR